MCKEDLNSTLRFPYYVYTNICCLNLLGKNIDCLPEVGIFSSINNGKLAGVLLVRGATAQGTVSFVFLSNLTGT